MKNIIFIGGVHGVGKGYICSEIASSLPITHLTASEVLNWTDTTSQDNKLVTNIEDTQARLINNLSAIVKDGANYLLDGHYVLLNQHRQPEKVPFDTFKSINPSKIIVVFEEVHILRERLQGRDGKEYDETGLKQFQDLEIAYAEEISQKLNVPLYKIKSTDFDLEKIKHFIQ